MSNTNKLILELRQFAKERDWEQFHSPKNLVMALSGEVGELTEHFQWLTEEASFLNNDIETKSSVAEELADILLYLLRLSDKLDIDLMEAAKQKIKLNAEKYPVKLSKGNHLKYNQLNKNKI
jgi:NTP pyrophosphatase (non-canonical NTP hydrolase)